MIGSIRFAPKNSALVNVQHELYWWQVHYLYSYPRERYLRAARLLGIDTELAKRIREKENFDHRILQPVHDEIAGYYDHKVSTGQTSLLDKVSYEERLRTDWAAFFQREVHELAEIDSIALAILTAVAFENTEQGHDAEGFLLTTIRARYAPSSDS